MSKKQVLPESTFTLEEYEEAVDAGEEHLQDLCDKSKTSDYYFKVWDQEDGDTEEDEVCVAVAPRIHYDSNEFVDELTLPIDHLLPVGLEYPEGCIYFVRNKSLEDVRQEMLDEGFIENDDLDVE